MTTICMTSTCLGCINLGGHLWVYLNWIRGCILSGCEVVLLEEVPAKIEPKEVLRRVRCLKKLLKTMHVPAQLCLIASDSEQRRMVPIALELQQETITLVEASEISDVFINSLYTLPAKIVHTFRKSVLLDIDPGLLQVWMSEGQLCVAKHDNYFTIGEKIGQPDSLVPDCDIRWFHTPPPVDIGFWPVVRSEIETNYTTITNWWGEWVRYGDTFFNNEKRTSFIEYFELPRQLDVSLEIAITKGSLMEQERRDLEVQGWRILNSDEVSDTPMAYQSYIQASRGEFSCAKPSCMRFQNAWISDRTICYLASGKPAVVQHTGESQFLPNGEGLFRFRTPTDVLHAFETIEADYETHARHARAIAEEFFEAGKVVGRVLEQAL